MDWVTKLPLQGQQRDGGGGRATYANQAPVTACGVASSQLGVLSSSRPTTMIARILSSKLEVNSPALTQCWIGVLTYTMPAMTKTSWIRERNLEPKHLLQPAPPPPSHLRKQHDLRNFPNQNSCSCIFDRWSTRASGAHHQNRRVRLIFTIPSSNHKHKPKRSCLAFIMERQRRKSKVSPSRITIAAVHHGIEPTLSLALSAVETMASRASLMHPRLQSIRVRKIHYTTPRGGSVSMSVLLPLFLVLLQAMVIICTRLRPVREARESGGKGRSR